MEQKQRDRIAWIAAIVLAPILVYLLATNVFKAGKRAAPPSSAAPAAAAVGLPPTAPVPAPPASAAAPPPLDPRRAEAQRKMAERLPRRNPFSAVTEPSAPPVDNSHSGAPAAQARAPDAAVKVTAIILRGDGKRVAMVNGRMLGEGDRVGEWTITKVNPLNVLMDNGTRQVVVGPR